jgi:hypothetical protein
LAAWLLHARGAESVDRLLPEAVVPAGCLIEALHLCQAWGHRLPCARLREAVVAMGALIEPLAEGDAVRGAELLVRADELGAGRMAPTEALALALAERLDLPIVTDDRWSALGLDLEFTPLRTNTPR